MRKIKLFIWLYIVVIFTGCVTPTKATITLSDITEKQISSIHDSHIHFVNLYYDKLAEDVNLFIDEKWAPLFISKTVQNEAFLEDLEHAYNARDISADDFKIEWVGKKQISPEQIENLNFEMKESISKNMELIEVLSDWSDEVQYQILKQRNELLQPINDQRNLVITEINKAYDELERSNLTIKSYLKSTANINEEKEKNDEKTLVMDKINSILNIAISNDEDLSVLLNTDEIGDNTITDYLKIFSKTKNKIDEILATE